MSPVVAYSAFHSTSPLPGTDGEPGSTSSTWMTWAPAAAAAVASAEAESMTTSSSTSGTRSTRLRRIVATMAPTVASSFNAGSTTLTRVPVAAFKLCSSRGDQRLPQ